MSNPPRLGLETGLGLDFKTMSQAIRFVERAGLRKMELAFVSPQLCRLTEVPLDLLRWGPSISRRSNQPA